MEIRKIKQVKFLMILNRKQKLLRRNLNKSDKYLTRVGYKQLTLHVKEV